MANIPNILITGGSGRLGRLLRGLLPDAYAPSRSEMDITDPTSCFHVASQGWDVVIHCAAFVSAAEAETNREACWLANVEGTRNMVRAFACRFVYLSTVYVFDGERGNYKESDVPGPVNFYGLTKLIGEQIVQEHPNTLIIRAAVRADPPWRFPKAFTDQWTSDDFMSVRAPEIAHAALSNHVGILHIGGARRSIYDLASSVSNVGKMKRNEFPGLNLPRDTSLDSSKWKAILRTR